MWFTLDIFGIALSLLTWALFVFTDCVVCMNVLATLFGAPDALAGEPALEPRIPWLPSWLRFTTGGYVVFFLYQFILLLALISHFQAMTTDPGTVTESHPPEELQNKKFCKLCEDRWKPPRAHHCKTCRRCIFRMDHHCPWVNNCVGFKNQKYFILFLGWTIVSCIATLLLLACGCIYWLAVQKSMAEASPPGSVGLLICSGLVCLVCLGGTIFVSDFLQEQIESIQLNSTLVETYQRTHGEQTNFMDHFRGVFGHRWWFWPFPVKTTPAPDYTEPAIPEDADRDFSGSFREDDNLGIAGSEHEERAQPSRTSQDSPASYFDGLLSKGKDKTLLEQEEFIGSRFDRAAPRQPGSAPRPRHRYGGGEASEPAD